MKSEAHGGLEAMGRREGVVDKLLKQEQADKDFTFELPNETDSAGKKIEGTAHWIRLKDGERLAEGKLFTPAGNDRNSLVIFEPGMPGDAVGWMDKKHVPVLLKEGYTVLVMRHLGTKIDTDRAPAFIQCPERQAKGAELNQPTIGNNEVYDVESLTHEPATALNILGKNFSEIKMVGHSLGALLNAASIPELDPEIKEKVSNYVSLSGFIGGINERAPAFNSIQGYYEYCAKYLNLGSPARNEECLKQIFDRLYSGENRMPENVMVSIVHSPNDEYLTLEGTEKFQEFLGRGLHITDKTQSIPEFHDLKNLQPETLLRLLKMHYPKSKHSVEVNRG